MEVLYRSGHLSGQSINQSMATAHQRMPQVAASAPAAYPLRVERHSLGPAARRTLKPGDELSHPLGQG